MSVRKEKCLELYTNLNKWKGGIDGGYWRDGLDEIWRDVWSLMAEPLAQREAGRRPQERHIGSPRGVLGCAT